MSKITILKKSKVGLALYFIYATFHFDVGSLPEATCFTKLLASFSKLFETQLSINTSRPQKPSHTNSCLLWGWWQDSPGDLSKAEIPVPMHLPLLAASDPLVLTEEFNKYFNKNLKDKSMALYSMPYSLYQVYDDTGNILNTCPVYSLV